ncbi:MAG: hypothetical protein DSY82_01925 [Flavobacteriia bacterium]|nr:MAG: hypothetical protein DSY82_01925 [Flavobacteriia bacterium]
MKIQYDKDLNALIINDDLKMFFNILKAVFIINLVSSIFKLYNNYLANIQIDMITVGLGIVNLLGLIFTFTRSVKKIIPVDEINYLYSKKYFTKRYFLKLKNGKIRNLPFIKYPQDMLELQRIVKESKIKNKLD